MYDILLLVDSMEAIKDLPDREAGALIKALIKHTDGEDPEKLPSMAKALYPLIRGQVERMADIRDKRAEAGRGGCPVLRYPRGYRQLCGQGRRQDL